MQHTYLIQQNKINSPIFNILPNLFYHSLYTRQIFPENASCPSPLNTSFVFCKNNHILWHFHSAVTRFREVNTDGIITLYHSYCNPVNCLRTFLTALFFHLFGTRSSSGSHIAFCFHVCVVCVNLEQFLWLLCHWWQWYFWRIQANCFIECSTVWAWLMFPHD